MGDMHFSQGDGEVSFCGAIEMSGSIYLKCSALSLKVVWKFYLVCTIGIRFDDTLLFVLAYWIGCAFCVNFQWKGCIER